MIHWYISKLSANRSTNRSLYRCYMFASFVKILALILRYDSYTIIRNYYTLRYGGRRNRQSSSFCACISVTWKFTGSMAACKRIIKWPPVIGWEAKGLFLRARNTPRNLKFLYYQKCQKHFEFNLTLVHFSVV